MHPHARTCEVVAVQVKHNEALEGVGIAVPAGQAACQIVVIQSNDLQLGEHVVPPPVGWQASTNSVAGQVPA